MGVSYAGYRKVHTLWRGGSIAKIAKTCEKMQVQFISYILQWHKYMVYSFRYDTRLGLSSDSDFEEPRKRPVIELSDEEMTNNNMVNN